MIAFARLWPRAVVHLPSLAFAAVLFTVPALTARESIVAAAGSLGALLALLGAATLWRWPTTAAACVFLASYAGALWLAGARVDLGGALAFGLALLFMLQAAELARCVRDATVVPGLVRAQLLRVTASGAATLVVAVLALPVASALASLVPFAAAPVVAAAGALGVVLAVAAALARSRL